MTNTPLVPPDISEFLRHIVRSTWGLEVLLLLRANSDRRWRRSEISREIRGSLSVVDEPLTAFVKARLVSENEEGTLKYDPADQQLDDLVKRLAELNAVFPFAVMKEVIWA